MDDVRLFGLGSSRAQADAVASALGTVLAAHEEREFEDGEHKARPLESVRGKDVYVVHSLHGDREQSGNDKLCRLLFFLAAVRDHGAARVTALVPYLCYARKDRRTQPGDPLITRYVAQLFEAVGTDCIATLDVHNPAAFENAFRCRAEHVLACGLFASRLAGSFGGRDVVVVSPDAGGMKRADALRLALAECLDAPVGLGMMEKRRSRGVVSGQALFADVAGCAVVIVDDMIASGSTVLRAAHAARAAGAASVVAVASHGLFVGDAGDALADPAIDRILVTDSVPPYRIEGRAAAGCVEVLPAAPLFAAAIVRMHGA
jgi:ribose-phosphate pyrophosphokinase